MQHYTRKNAKLVLRQAWLKSSFRRKMSPYWAKQSSGSKKMLPTVICYNYERLPHTLSTQLSFLLRVWGAVLRCCLISKNEFLISIIWTSDINDKGFFCMQKIQILKIDFFISDDYFILHQIRNFDVKKWFSDIRKAIFDIKNFKLIYWYQKF